MNAEYKSQRKLPTLSVPEGMKSTAKTKNKADHIILTCTPNIPKG
jgi:hypothetical protein